MPALLFLLFVSICSADISTSNRSSHGATTCLLADSSAKVIYSVAVGSEESEPNAKYFSNNTVSDVCMDTKSGIIFAAGAGIKLAKISEAFSGGHIAAIGITGVAERVAYFLAESTAIECDPLARVIVFAIAQRGIYGSSYDGSEQWKVLYILGSHIQNIFLDAITQTCYFVDISTTDIYALKYMETSSDLAKPIGRAGAGAVGCTLDSDNGMASLNIVYDSCRIEKCSADGPFTGCPVVHTTTGGSCLAVTADADSIMTYDNRQHRLFQLSSSDGFVTATFVAASSSSFISGMACTTDADFADACDPNPCLNGGVCEVLTSGFSCVCSSLFTGDTCESAIVDDADDCEPNPCLHGGTCVAIVSGYFCDCPSGFSGDSCETAAADDTDDCQPNPCLNGGTCLDLVSAYECECLSGIGGESCEEGDPELLAILENLENFGIILGNNTNFANLNDFYADDTIIDFLDYPQYRGKEGHAQLAARERPLFRTKVPTNLEVRRICDLCFEVRFKMQEFYVDAELGVRYVRVFQVWCFNFDSLLWEVKSLAVTPDPDPRL